MEKYWEPQAKQKLALSSDADEILYGGARGGGKTDAGQAWLLYDIDKEKYRALVIRRNADDLKDWVDRAGYFYRPTKAKITGNPAEVEWPSGAKARTGHLKDEEAYTKYQGHEYQKILIEELSHIPREKDYLKLLASNRSTIDGVRPQVFCTTNPDDPGLEWIKERWEIPDEPDPNQIYTTYKEVEMLQPDWSIKMAKRKLVFVPARVEDNPVLLTKDPNYVVFLESLKSSDPSLYQAWRNGSWRGYGTDGSYYRDNLILAEKNNHVVDGLFDPTMPVYTWCDLGISDAFAIVYLQGLMHQWRVIDYDEYEGLSLGAVINHMKQKPYIYGEHYAPHDIAVRELGSGKSRIEIAAENGIDYLIYPNLPIADGINAVKTRFAQLWFDKEKTKLLRKRLARYHKEFDERRGIWKDKPYHDVNSHGADAVRGWAVTSVQFPDYDFAARVEANRNRVRSSR